MSEKIRLIPPARLRVNELRIPGSKSYTNRALILASLADGESRLYNPSYSDDSKALIQALAKLGVDIIENGDFWVVKGRGGRFFPFKGKLDIGPAGTCMRFLTSLCAMIEGAEVILCGSERMHARPINHLVDALRSIGADIEYLGNQGCPPLKIRGRGDLRGGTVALPGNQSSQYFSSLLMAAPLLSDGLKVLVEGEQISRSYIDMTFASLEAFSIPAINDNYKSYTVSAGSFPAPCDYQVEGDASGASYFWGIAAISAQEVRLNNINPASVQGDLKFSELLQRMGCTVDSGYNGKEGWVSVRGAEKLRGIEADMDLMPDTAQTLAVIGAVAEGAVKITGLSSLRIKETDRIEALHIELARLGVRSETAADSITVFPGPIGPAEIRTYDDHRMAMSFAVLGARFSGIEICEPKVVTKSFPEFWKLMQDLGIGIA